MKLATWNVNSLRVRLPHLLAWLEETQPTLVGLQETKLIDEKFPQAEIEAAGYDVAFVGQPTYNGVAILSRRGVLGAPKDVVFQDPRLPDDQKRLIAATYPVLASGSGAANVAAPASTLAGQSIRFVCAYVPNGSEVGSEKYAYKLAWLKALQARMAEEVQAHPLCALVGDFNIAPADADIYDPAAWHEKILCSTPEREAFRGLLSLGLTDILRAHAPDAEGLFTWWDYRAAGFRRNLGMRIDHLLLSPALATVATTSEVDKGPRKKEQPSDHAPVWVALG